jgi:hypothetical protein
MILHDQVVARSILQVFWTSGKSDWITGTCFIQKIYTPSQVRKERGAYIFWMKQVPVDWMPGQTHDNTYPAMVLFEQSNCIDGYFSFLPPLNKI